MNKTPHYFAVELAHERIDYGEILAAQPIVLAKLKQTIFMAARDVITEATAESKKYSNGYAAGCRRSDKAMAEERQRADLAARRAERLEAGLGIGHCEGCAHWVRGGGGPNAASCAWGICHVERAAGTPWGTFVQAEEGAGRVQTSPHFGCVLFQAKAIA